MVTVIGTISQVVGIILILFYDSTMTLPLPPWIYIVFALCIFLYQTFDAIDGKHARNTGRSSPVGQLMDHGCDAFSNSFMVIMIAQTHLFGGTIYTIIIQSLVQLTFYTIQWQEHHTGFLITHIHNMGVTEFQFIAISIVLIPVFLGNSFSQIRLFSGMISISELLVYTNAI
jgi:phosphatidylglycerophosphate synthase